jgi:hypothetical protein
MGFIMDLESIINEAPSVRNKALREGQGSIMKGFEFEKWIGKTMLYVEKHKTLESAFYQRFMKHADSADNARGFRIGSFDKMLALLEAMKECEYK